MPALRRREVVEALASWCQPFAAARLSKRLRISRPLLFGELRERVPKLHQDAVSAPSYPPWPIDANDGDTYFIASIGVLADDIGDAETYARRLAKLEAIELDISWSYRRPKVLRGRKTVVKHQTIAIDCDERRAVARRYWAVYQPDLIDLIADR